MGVGRRFKLRATGFAATGWLDLMQGTIQAPVSATCSQRKLDLFVVSKDLAHAVKGVFVVGDSPSSPHSAVRLVLGAKCRAGTARELEKQPKLTAFQPFRPTPKKHYGIDGEAVAVAELADPLWAMSAAWAIYSGIVTVIEDQICDFNCLDEQESEAQSSVRPTTCNQDGYKPHSRSGPPHNPVVADLETPSQMAKVHGMQAEHDEPTPVHHEEVHPLPL